MDTFIDIILFVAVWLVGAFINNYIKQNIYKH